MVVELLTNLGPESDISSVEARDSPVTSGEWRWTKQELFDPLRCVQGHWQANLQRNVAKVINAMQALACAHTHTHLLSKKRKILP